MMVKPSMDLAKLDFRDGVDYLTERITEIKFTRTREDREAYLAITKELLDFSIYHPESDWPLLRLCSIEKGWTNIFSERMLKYSLTALSRRETLDAFVYACRGIAFNNKPGRAIPLLEELGRSTRDKQLANLTNLFIGICQYDRGDFYDYEDSIQLFLENKDSDFQPYISVPATTVYLPMMTMDENFEFPSIDLPDLKHNTPSYVISVSCDVSYFTTYGKYLCESFIKQSDENSLLCIAIIKNNGESNEAYVKWQSHKKINIVEIDFDFGANFRPVSSIVRYLRVKDLLTRFGCPVVVMDLDAVILSDLNQIIAMTSGFDIGSRILAEGVAPWEKYTGGFTIFQPTDIAEMIATSIIDCFHSVYNPNHEQWWIDQNCFEGSIRVVKKSGQRVRIQQLMNVRDEYVSMPTGPTEAKLHYLDLAFKKIGGANDE